VQVIDAGDGHAALVLAETARPDLILLDVNLPGMSGLEVCERLRRDHRFGDTRIVMLTAAAQQTDVALGLAAGADHYLTKPFSPVRLLSIVEGLLPQATVWQPE
jgi:DNA-binding response OmpR family regulator